VLPYEYWFYLIYTSVSAKAIFKGNIMLIDIKKRLENIDLDIRTITAEQAVSEQKNNGGTLIDVREAAGNRSPRPY